MNALKTGRLLSLLAGMTAAGMTTAHAAGAPAPVKPAPTKAAAPAVTVKLGDAMLEKYHNGDPSARTTIVRGGDAVPKAKNDGRAKKHS